VNPVLGWALAVAAVAIGWTRYGWPGVLLALGLVVFWLLLQFSRALRAMQQAGRSPVGHVDSAVMLNARLRPGMTLLQVVGLTRSLGQRVWPDGVEPECWRWIDGSGASLTLVLRRGRLERWQLERPGPEPDARSASGQAPAAGGAIRTSDDGDG
jgi:hypothetical protein